MTDIYAILSDWGTSRRRAWAVDKAGTVLAERRDDQGLLAVARGGFEASFRSFVGEWLDAAPEAPVMMGGMVGSRMGWQEAPYLDVPVSLDDLPSRLCVLPDLDRHPMRIVPGLACRIEGRPDVLRGEECQLFGAWISGVAQDDEGPYLLPGTHSKWVRLDHGRINLFRTYMTGEVFGAMSTTGTLAQLMDQAAPHDPGAFAMGLGDIRAASSTEMASRQGGLLNLLFAVRGRGLFGQVPPSGLKSYLSGLLIGAEVADALAWCGIESGHAKQRERVNIIGEGELAALYGQALSAVGIPFRALEPDPLFRAALTEIARRAGM